MNKKILFVTFFLLFSGLAQAQIIKEDQIAVFYLHCQDVPKDNLITKEDLTWHIFDEAGPIRKFWEVNFNGHYQYTGEVFVVEIPMTEDEFKVRQEEEKDANGSSPFLVNILKARLDEKNQTLDLGNFEPEKFNKAIFMLGESSLHNTGKYWGYYQGEVTHKISRKEFTLSTITLKGIQKGPVADFELPVDNKKEDEALPKIKYPGLGLWPHYDATLLHEWGHSFGVFHASMPCADGGCEKIYDSTCSDYYRFTCFAEDRADKDGKYSHFAMAADPFCLMGGIAASLAMNAAMRDLCGMLPGTEKTVLAESTKQVKVKPYLTRGAVKRAALIRIDKEIASPLIDVPLWKLITPEQKPTARINLYATYRTGESYDIHLNNEKLSKNTSGLMIHLALSEVNVKPYSFQISISPDQVAMLELITEEDAIYYEKDFSYKSWLLDMSPQDGNAHVTLNPGWEFYHKGWGVSIQNVRPVAGDMVFDVEYGAKGNLVSNVYKTKFFSDDQLKISEAPLLYSSGLAYRLVFEDKELKVKRNDDNDEIVWVGSDKGITPSDAIKEIALKDGNLELLSASNEIIWQSGTKGHPNAELLITEEGELNILDEDGTVLWKGVSLSCNGSPTGSKITFLSKEGRTIKVKVDWDEGAGFNGKTNLDITNGVCTDCPQLGGIDRRFPRSATYVIEQDESLEKVIIKWASPTPKRYCGNGSLVIPND